MVISGLQKLTLLDYPSKMACIIFTGGCNFRCPFCHNAGLVIRDEEKIEEEEILAFLNKRKNVLDGVVITGGEPLLHKDINLFLEKVKLLGYSIKLDTNGTQFEQLVSLVEKKLVDYVAVDVKNSFEKYGETIGKENFDLTNVKRTIEYLKTNVVDYEFRTTVVKELHAQEDFLAIAKIVEGCSKYFLQQYIDSGDTIEKGLSAFKKEELENFLQIFKERGINAQLRGL